MMKEINISKEIVKNRRRMGLTQEELAEHMGVSKASVSKWETGQSYPDITLLPQLATFFNISLDCLMGYEPQMTAENIKKTHGRLAADFSEKPFDVVHEECSDLVKKYYSCFPLLMKIAELYINHFPLAGDKDEQFKVLEETLTLCKRIESESDDVNLARQAQHIEALAYMVTERPEQVLEIFGEEGEVMLQSSDLVAKAWQIMGNSEKAIEILQQNMYQNLLIAMNAIPSLMLLNSSDMEKVDELWERGAKMGEIFKVDKLHPNTMGIICLTAAQIYGGQGDREKALKCLKHYLKVAEAFFPYKLCGDDFFDKIQGWLDENVMAPRSQKAIRESLVTGVTANPFFEFLKDDQEFKEIVKALEHIKISEGKQEEKNA